MISLLATGAQNLHAVIVKASIYFVLTPCGLDADSAILAAIHSSDSLMIFGFFVGLDQESLGEGSVSNNMASILPSLQPRYLYISWSTAIRLTVE